MTDQQTINELIQKGMTDFAAEKGNPGALLLKSNANLSQDHSVDVKGTNGDDGIKPGLSREEFTQLCYLLQHNLIPAESLVLSCLFFSYQKVRSLLFTIDS